MGLYNSMWVSCPNCRTSVEMQTKAGDSSLKTITEDNITADEAEDLDDDYCFCENCDTNIYVRIVPKVKTVYETFVRAV